MRRRRPASAYGVVDASNRCITSLLRGGRFGDSPCPLVDQRQVAYGLLGPDAMSITYHDANGRSKTEPTSGPDGAYLIVKPQPMPLCGQTPTHGCAPPTKTDNAGLDSPNLQPGVITAVTYRDGHVCRPSAPTTGPHASCPPVGYARHITRISRAQTTAPITVLARDQHCSSTHLPSAHCPRSLVLHIAFTARVTATKVSSYYEYFVNVPRQQRKGGCPGVYDVGMTSAPIRAGQQVHFTNDLGEPYASCTGQPLTASVAFVFNDGLGDPRLASAPIVVGTFHSTVG